MSVKVTEGIIKPSNLTEAVGKDEKKLTEGTESSFLNRIRRIESDNVESKMKELANKIIEQGEKLGSKVDVKELKIYKRFLSEFLGEAVGNSQKFSKDSFIDRRGRYRVYATIKKINNEVDQLTKDVLASEKDHLNILKRIEDIRGLILDIVL